VFRIIAMIVRLAPLGAFGAMAFTIVFRGRALVNLGELILPLCNAALFVAARVARRAPGRIFNLPFHRIHKDEFLMCRDEPPETCCEMMAEDGRLAVGAGVGLVSAAKLHLDGTNI